MCRKGRITNAPACQVKPVGIRPASFKSKQPKGGEILKKFILTETTKEFFGITLYQIKAARAFGGIEEGELGGWVEKEENLSTEGDAWVSGDALVSGNARVSGNAWVSGDARVSGNAWVSGNARVYGNALVSGDALVYGNARV